MLDSFDLALLNAMQRDADQTAEQLARSVPLSPSAIARRLRRLRSGKWITGSVALLSRRLTERRLRAAVFVQLSEHANRAGKDALLKRIGAATQIQFCYELAGAHDLMLLFDCRDMSEFNAVADAVLVADTIVRRFETSFVKREAKFAPFVALTQHDAAG
jgi:Lrp/AsnC family leucine-responsive transcriptional regulator